MDYNEQFLKFQEALSQKNSIEAKVKEMKSQRGELNDKIREYKASMWDEQIDVERLERISLSNVIYTLIGKRKDMLQKEEMEAYAAQVKYDSAVHELKMLEDEICRKERQLREIYQCERQYEALVQEKGATVKASETDDAERIICIEKQIIEQINESKGKVQSVKTQIELILSKLRNYENGADQQIKRLENEKAAIIVNATL